MTAHSWPQPKDLARRAAARADNDAERTLADSLLLQSAHEGSETLPLPALTQDPLLGRHVGAYRLEREIGRGGMGVVYLGARVDNAFQQQVAVKLIKRGMDTDFILRRFRRERQILASLNHPHIARLLDGGTTEDGLPYFVMEFITGQPLYRHCDARQLGLLERLHLFRHVCDAVHFAHQHLVVHRDLKPPNILVSADGMPHLLDFGIAKLLHPELAADTMEATGTGMRLMTPEYASPEQVRGEPATPASDIYSLGVLLYELLTGQCPLRLRSRALHEIVRAVCEEEPVWPSERVLCGRDARSLAAICEARQTDRETLRQALLGNLDRIVLKALHKDPRQRYASAAALRADLTRHLEGRPISAPFYAPAPPAAKLFRVAPPNEATTIAILPLKLLSVPHAADTGDKYLGIGLADALITRLSNIHSLAVRPTSSVIRYEAENANPLDAGRELRVDYVLDGRIKRVGERVRVSLQLLDVQQGASAWAQQFDEQFTDVLRLEDTLTAQVADVLVPHLTGEDCRRFKKRGTDDPAAFEAYLRGRYHLNTFTEEGFAKASESFQQAVALDPRYALPYAGLADYYNWLAVWGVLPPSECVQRALAAATKAIELDSELSEAWSAFGFAVLIGEFDWARGEAACRRAIELNPHNAQAHVWYSLQLAMEGRVEEALQQARRGIELDPLMPYYGHNLGWCLYFARRFDESVAQYRRVTAAHPLYALAHFGLSWTLRYCGEHDEAIRESRRSVELTNQSSLVLLQQAQALAAAGLRAEAATILDELTATAAERYVSAYNVALIHCFLGAAEKAMDWLERAFDQREVWLVWLGVEPVFDGLRDHPRFRALLQKTNNPAVAQTAAA